MNEETLEDLCGKWWLPTSFRAGMSEGMPQEFAADWFFATPAKRKVLHAEYLKRLAERINKSIAAGADLRNPALVDAALRHSNHTAYTILREHDAEGVFFAELRCASLRDSDRAWAFVFGGEETFNYELYRLRRGNAMYAGGGYAMLADMLLLPNDATSGLIGMGNNRFLHAQEADLCATTAQECTPRNGDYFCLLLGDHASIAFRVVETIDKKDMPPYLPVIVAQRRPDLDT